MLSNTCIFTTTYKQFFFYNFRIYTIKVHTCGVNYQEIAKTFGVKMIQEDFYNNDTSTNKKQIQSILRNVKSNNFQNHDT